MKFVIKLATKLGIAQNEQKRGENLDHGASKHVSYDDQYKRGITQMRFLITFK